MAAGDVGKSLPSLLRLLPLFRESETASEALHCTFFVEISWANAAAVFQAVASVKGA